MIDSLSLVLGNISHYVNIGLAMVVLGVILLIVGFVSLWKYLNQSWDVSMYQFNRRFLQDTGTRFSDVRLSQARKNAADNLHIGEAVSATAAQGTESAHHAAPGRAIVIETELLDETEEL
jgi:hypothetical protein